MYSISPRIKRSVIPPEAPARQEVSQPSPQDLKRTRTSFDGYKYFQNAHRGAPTPQDAESLTDLYDRLCRSREEVTSNARALAIVHTESAVGLRQGVTLGSMNDDNEYSFFHHQNLKRKKNLWEAEEGYLQSLDTQNLIERALLDQHRGLCSRRSENIQSTLSEYNKRWKVQKISLPSSRPRPSQTPPPSSPTMSNTSTLHTPSSKTSLRNNRGRSSVSPTRKPRSKI